MNSTKSILVITPVKHINGFESIFEQSKYNLIHFADPRSIDELNKNNNVIAVFTNPNKTKLYVGEKFINLFPSLKVVCTASTGTIHIDKKALNSRNIKLLSIKEERHIISGITSTAEHSLALTLAAIRNIVPAANSVSNGKWDYEPYIGQQFKDLTIGVIGYGRLGTYYASYCDALGARVIVYDPYKDINHPRISKVVSLFELAEESDVISLHVHITPETQKLISHDFLKHAKDSLALINTSRGEIICEEALISYLHNNPKARYASDVISGEYSKSKPNCILEASKQINEQILITPHIGGMTKEAQETAYCHAGNMLLNYLDNNLHQ